MSIITQYLLSLLHCFIIISLLPRGCVSETLAIIQSPTSQIIALGETSTFYCSGSEPHSEPHPGIIVDIETDDMMIHTATVTIEGSETTNNTKLDCTVSNFLQVKRSNTATLTVIGPPAAITFTEFNIDVKLKRFLAIWSVPFSHMNHSISSYNVSVINLNTTEVYQRTITVSSEDNIMCSAVNDTLDFPSLTNACDIINVTVIAINDIGSSEPTSASLYIPTVPEMDISVTTAIYFHSNGTPVIMLDIKLPLLCWFERFNYSILLRHNGNVSVVMEKSVLNPPEYIIERITDNVVANTYYSIVIEAGTTVWNITTTPYNFSTEFTATVTTSTVSSCDVNNISSLVLGVTIGTGALLIIVVVIGIIVLLVFILQQKKTKDVTTTRSVENMQVDSMRCSLMPNPIYDGPVYDAIRPPNIKLGPTFRPQQPSTAANGQSMYCESPIQRQGLTHGQKEMEDCYIQMKTSKRQ